MTQPSDARSRSAVAATHPYELSSDLAQACLPARIRDSGHWRLAWVNSICLLFLVVGLAGLKPPGLVQRSFSPVEESVTVNFTPPPEAPKLEPQVLSQIPAGSAEASERTPQPQVVGVVAAAEPSLVAFEVPVEGAVTVASPAQWTPPPPQPTAPVSTTPQPTRFDPGAAAAGSAGVDGGRYPPPTYPPYALRNHYEGTVTITLTVAPSGAVTSAKVLKTSGFTVLDEAALDAVRNQWRFPPGTARSYYWPCEFRLE